MHHISVAVAFGAAVVGCQAGASTVTYYYVGAPAAVSGYNLGGSFTEGRGDRLRFNTGYFTIDLAAYQLDSLANVRLRYDAFHGEYYFGPATGGYQVYNIHELPPPYPEYPYDQAWSFDFAFDDVDDFTTFDLAFNENEELVEWEFTTFWMGRRSWGIDGVVSSEPRFYVNSTEYIVFHSDGGGKPGLDYYVLDSLGYGFDHPDYQSLQCGSWTGINAYCESGETILPWATQFAAMEPGQWFRNDLQAFARQIIINMALSDVNPPRFYTDIPPASPTAVPLPGGLPLLLGSMALGAAFLRRHRAAA